MTDARDSADMIDRTLANEPTDSSDAAEPMLPMLSTEPTEPIDRSEFVDPMLSIELRERALHREPFGGEVGSIESGCHGRCEHGGLMDRDQLLGEYDTTVVSVLHPEHGWTDPALVAIEMRTTGVVMTAWNPGPTRPSAAENRAANVRLRIELDELGLEVWRADGHAPDGSALEEGWIVWGMPVDQGLRVAARFGQFAIYLYDDAGMRQTVACPA
jgi:hypothetical protein